MRGSKTLPAAPRAAPRSPVYFNLERRFWAYLVMVRFAAVVIRGISRPPVRWA
ncbi:MAG: hypothetical protein M3018_07920 [Actinomycetota bacterium]|nr:hypothetical protein [Actinomycetota bacterium]